jgi:acyl-ACP thioesterase
VVRRTVLAVHRFPVYLEPLTLTTWCAGFGAAWAERRVSVRGDDGGRVESATLWVHLDPISMRPARMPTEFLDVFGPSSAGRTVSSKQVRASCPDTPGVHWPQRFTDFDVLEHVNNAVYFSPVEQVLAERRDLRAPLTVVVEHGDPIERDDIVRWVLRERSTGGGFDGWLVGDGRQFAAVSVVPGAS